MTSNFPKVIPSPLLIGKRAILIIFGEIFDMTITILGKIFHEIKKLITLCSIYNIIPPTLFFVEARYKLLNVSHWDSGMNPI